MKIAVISDIHGNAIALNQCLDSIDGHGVDRIVALGDYLGYFPDHEEVLITVRKRVSTCLLGNHDAMLLGILPLEAPKESIYRLKSEGREISEDNMEFLRTLLPFHILEEADTKMLFVHGSPFNPLTEYVTASSDTRHYGMLKFNYLFCGHTHIAFIKELGKSKIINVGSCGLPREDGRFGNYALLDTKSGIVELRSFELDLINIVKRYENDVDISVLNVLKRRKS